jgi:hypothetical protein
VLASHIKTNTVVYLPAALNAFQLSLSTLTIANLQLSCAHKHLKAHVCMGALHFQQSIIYG